MIDSALLLSTPATDYLSWTPGSASGNGKQFVVSFWFKKGRASSNASQMLSVAQTQSFILGINSEGSGYGINMYRSVDGELWSVGELRDYAGWMHCCLALDTTLAAEADRCRLWLNGVPQTWYNAQGYPTQYGTSAFLTAIQHEIGRNANNTVDTYAAPYYYAQFCVFDGLTITDPVTDGLLERYGEGEGQVHPVATSALVAVANTQGGTSFVLDFSNSSSLGTDASTNGNDWTVNGSPEQVSDTPTRNFPVWSPIHCSRSASPSGLIDGNRTFSSSAGSYDVGFLLSYPFRDGYSYYMELDYTSAYVGGSGGYGTIGVVPLPQAAFADGNTTAGNFNTLNAYGYQNNGNKVDPDGSQTSYGSAWGDTPQIIQVAISLSAGAVWFGLNGTWQNGATTSEIASGDTTHAAFTGLSGDHVLMWYRGTYQEVVALKEPGGYTYTAPEGFVPLTTDTLPAATFTNPQDYIHVEELSHDGTSSTVSLNWDTSVDDTLVIVKRFDSTGDWYWVDTVRGADNVLKSNDNAAETTVGGSVGFSGADVAFGSGLASGTYLVMAFRTAPGFFDIVAYTGDGVSGRIVSHDLGDVPSFFTVKRRSNSEDWHCYHKNIGATSVLLLNTADAGGNQFGL